MCNLLSPQSPAEEGGLRRGDLVINAGGTEINDPGSLLMEVTDRIHILDTHGIVELMSPLLDLISLTISCGS